MGPSTHSSILNGFKDDATRAEAMRRFSERYQPLILRWCLRNALQAADAEDVAQGVVLKLFEKLPDHEHDPDRGRFRAWLSRVVANAVHDDLRDRARHWADRGAGGSDALEAVGRLQDPGLSDDLAAEVDELHQAVLHKALEAVRGRVSAPTWEAFHRTAILGRPAQEVADELGVDVASVYQSKHRVKEKVQEECARALRDS